MTHHTFHFPKNTVGWKKEIMKAFEIIKLNKAAMTSVAADDKANGPATVFIGVAALANALGLYLFPPVYVGIVYRMSFASVVMQALMAFVGMVIFASLIGLIVEHGFKGKAKLPNFLRVFGYLSLVGVVSIIPNIGFFAGLWGLVVVIVAVRTVYKI